MARVLKNLSRARAAAGRGVDRRCIRKTPALARWDWHAARKGAIGAVLAITLSAGGSPALAHAGHGVNHYPSYYPQEILIDHLDPAAAATELGKKTLHAFIGTEPAFTGPVPDHVKTVESLGSFVVFRFNPNHKIAAGSSYCAAATKILAGMRRDAADMVFHPYPITPYHGDYLHHLDRVEAIKAAVAVETADQPPLRIRAWGSQAAAIIHPRWRLTAGDWDVSLEVVAVDDLIGGAHYQTNGLLGPPWVREGWFQAIRLLSPAVVTPGSRDNVESAQDRLLRGVYLNLAERANLERELVTALTSDCRRVVVGYTVKREYYNADFTDGAENISVDAQLGMNSPVFVRTTKLKDYPWNGSLRVALASGPEAAWNPVAGFTDMPGKLIWSAIGEPALVPFPSNASWLPNRLDFTITRSHSQSGGIKVPDNALRPAPGSGALGAAGPLAFASTKVVYSILNSPFLDGTEMEIADLLFPFVLAYRWGAKEVPGDTAYDPHIAAALAQMQDRLIGLRVARVNRTVKPISPGLDLVQTTPVVEIYLRDTPGDEQQLAALAPPWTSVPWHLLALIEEAVQRGVAAFSKEEALRRNVPWLDLVRDRSMQQELVDLIGEFERERYRPEALKVFVTAEAAMLRWRALRTFAAKNGHLLVTNGPYRLKEWKRNSTVLQAVREASYPLGFGIFDRYVNPPRAVIRDMTYDGGRVIVSAEADITVKVQRHTRIERQPLTRRTSHGLFGLLVVTRYLLVGPDASVVDAGKMQWLKDGRFAVSIPDGLPPGQYTMLAAIFLDGNAVLPSAKVLRVEVDAKG